MNHSALVNHQEPAESLAAEQGHAQAQCDLGEMYYDGAGVPHDYAEAIKWWKLAAEQGHEEAQYNLANNA